MAKIIPCFIVMYMMIECHLVGDDARHLDAVNGNAETAQSKNESALGGETLQYMIDNFAKYPLEVQHTLNVLIKKIGWGHDFVSRLKQVKELNLSYGGAIKDLTPLAYLTNLEVLELDSQRIEDIKPLASLTKLKRLVLSNNKITDIKALKSLSNLKSLLIYNNKITDIEPLSGLTHLEELWIFGNQMKDISALAKLTNLKELHSGKNLIEDIAPLAKLFHLEKLDLNNNCIKDLKPLAQCIELEELSLSHNKIDNLKPLTGLINLTSLGLTHNNITDVACLEKLERLECLYLCHNQIKNAEPLATMKNMRFLYLKHNCITKSKFFEQSKHIECIELEGNPLKDSTEFTLTQSWEPSDSEKWTIDLADSAKVIESIEGREAFARGISGKENVHLQIPLPSSITHDELFDLITDNKNSPEEDEEFEHLIAYPWPGCIPWYVGVGSTGANGNSLDPGNRGIKICCAVFSIKKPHEFEVIARTEQPLSLRYISKKNSGRLAAAGQFDELVRFDQSIFKIAPHEHAFGLRLAFNESYSGGFGYFQNIVLFAVKNKTVVPILNHPIYSLVNCAGSWNEDSSRQHVVTEEEWDLSFAKKKHKGYFDVQLTTKKKIKGEPKSSYLVWEDGQYALQTTKNR